MREEYVQDIIDQLTGTCMHQPEDFEDINRGPLTDEELNYIFDTVTPCDYCGWWWETADLDWNEENGEVLCHHCYEE